MMVALTAPVPLTITGLGDIEHVDFGGAPVQVSCTAPEKPSLGVTDKLKLELSPAWMVAVVGDADTVNSAGLAMPELHCATGVHACVGPLRSFLTNVIDPFTVTLGAPPRLILPPELKVTLPVTVKNVTISPGP